MKTILITGASGLIGNALTDHLSGKGYTIRHLGRSKKGKPGVDEFTWDPDKGEIDQDALRGTDIIVHLAGSNVADGKWTGERKKQIMNSRVKSTLLLLDTIKKTESKPAKLIAASAMGYYGVESNEQSYAETDPPGNDFMAEVCVEWEKSVGNFESLNVPVLIYRIGVVLSDQGGALKVMAQPVKLFAGTPVGSGRQIVSWIHIDDLCALLMKGIEEDHFYGTYNAVAPNPVSNKTLVKAIGKALRRPVWPVPVPGFMLRILLGEQADIVLKGVSVSAAKITGTGYRFQFSEIGDAVNDLLEKK